MSSLLPALGPTTDREDLTEQQIQQLMSVISNMDSVRSLSCSGGEGRSPPPTDEEIRQFIDYVGMGVVNQERVEYDERRQEDGQPDPPKRSKQASQYFWRRHYLSIIQEEEEQGDGSNPSSRANSRPASTYENGIFRIPRILSRSPLCSQNYEKRDSRESWESEMSVDSLTSINSILSEEGSITSTGSFQSDTLQPESGSGGSETGRRAYESLSSLLDSVPPPSNTPDSNPPPSNTPDSLVADSPRTKSNFQQVEKVTNIQTGMGSKFKQQLQEIEARKRNEGKIDVKKTVFNQVSQVAQVAQVDQVAQVARVAPVAPVAPIAPTRPTSSHQSVYNLSNVSPPVQVEVKT